MALTLLAAGGLFLPSCSRPQGAIMGYEYRPRAEGKLELYDDEGNATKTLGVSSEPGADCGAGRPQVVDGLPPEWQAGSGPRVTCLRPEPSLDFYSSRVTTLDWPSESGDYPGFFYLENQEAPVDYHIELEEDRGELTPIPVDGDDSSLEPTSPDYYRRYRVTATIDCDDSELLCEGTWRLDVLYDQPRDQVRWLYTHEE